MAKNKTFTDFIGENTKIPADNCISIEFHRPANSNPVSVSGRPIASGQSWVISQNYGDCDTTDYDVIFTNSGATNELYVSTINMIEGV